MTDASSTALAADHLLSDEAIEALINDRRMEEARAAVLARLTFAAHDADALFYRGACAMVDRDFAAARADFAAAAAAAARPEARFHAAEATALLNDNRFEQALKASEAALALSPDDLAALVTHVRVLHGLKKFDAALPFCERLSTLALDLPETRQLMAQTLHRLGRLEVAFAWYHGALELSPDDTGLKMDIAVCVAHQGDLQQALQRAYALLHQAPQEAKAIADLGIRAQRGGSPVLALHCFRYGYERFPHDLTLCVNLGITTQGLGQTAESLFYLGKALDLDAHCADAWFFSGTAYHALKRQDKAIECWEKCLAEEPQHAQALLHYASIKKERGEIEEAKRMLRAAIESDPWQSIYPYLNLHHFLVENGELEEAAEVLAKGLAIDPDSEALRQAEASLLLKRGDIAGANARFRQILEEQPSNPDALSGLLFCSNYDPELTPERIAAAYKSWDERFARHLAPPPDHVWPNEPKSEKRLKIGYVSGDFRTHSVAFFAEPLLTHHDHEQFEIFCYANQRGGDAITRRFMEAADHWRWILDLSDDAVMELIRMDGIDILVDLSNHTAYHRLYLFARKPAPIQMTTIGMPTTTGIAAIDYRITDEYMDPPGLTEVLHAEKLLRILSGWCYRPSEEGREIEVGPLPALSNGHLTFASFNAFGKINPRVFRLWGRLLQAIPDAELVVATGGKDGDAIIEAQVRQTCEQCGVPLDRLKPVGRKPFKEYLEYHNEVDIVLDAFPYTGATVTAHALWMGVPVITRAGPSPINRSATSMMHSVGLPEFVATSEDDYIAIACRFAGDLQALADIRQGLRARMQASPLMDGERVTRSLEEAYRRVWREWCATQKEKKDGTGESGAAGTESSSA